jgi:hypothetical protein
MIGLLSVSCLSNVIIPHKEESPVHRDCAYRVKCMSSEGVEMAGRQGLVNTKPGAELAG